LTPGGKSTTLSAVQLDDTAIRRRLGAGYVLHYLEEVASTNDPAMAAARAGAPGGQLWCTDMQTNGRGRRGTTWVAPEESSVLCSLLSRTTVPYRPHELAILTGVGVARGLRTLEIPATIKWPNDLMLADRKIGGILTETHGDAVVIGVGLNCTIPDEAFPEALRARAGSLHALGHPVRREEVLVAVVRELTRALRQVETGGIIKVLYDWNTMNWLGRRKVRVSGPLGVVEGDGLFLDGRKLVFHVFKDHGVVPMPLSSTVEAR